MCLTWLVLSGVVLPTSQHINHLETIIFVYCRRMFEHSAPIHDMCLNEVVV